MRGIVVKWSGAILLLILMVLFPLGYVIDRLFTGFCYSQTQTEVSQLSTRYAQMIAQSPDLMTVNMVGMMARFANVDLVITDQSGGIMAQSRGLLGQKVAISEWGSLPKGRSMTKVLRDSSSGNRLLVAGSPIVIRHTFYGGVFVVSSLAQMDQSIQKARAFILLSGVGVFLLALGFTWFLTRKLSDPLLQMERATRQIAKGNLATRVQVTTGDEIGSLAQAINDLARDLERIQETRSQFFANISHELRTPITYLEGYAKVLKEGLYQTEEEKEQYLSIIQEESGRLTHLIRDLFELSKMEEGKINLNLEWIDLREIMESVMQKTGLRVKEKGLDVTLQVQDDLPLIYGDGLRMEQILINLVDNAIRYTEQGTISLQVISSRPDQVMMIVEDTGIGIPAEELPFIFERFYRVEKSRSRQYGGTGLGLAIVKHLIELQGGTIHVSSQVGKGSKFEIVLPIPQHEEGPT